MLTDSSQPCDYIYRTYVIFNVSELDIIDFSQVFETSAETVMRSVDRTKTFVSYKFDMMPDFINLLKTKEGPYNHSELNQITSTSEWQKIYVGQ